MDFESALNFKANSFTFIRFVLAIFVIFSHSFYLGGYGQDPLFKPFQITFASFAVESFFVISGFLVTASFLKSAFLRQYLWKRFLRIFPAFWACLLFSGLMLAPIIYFIEHNGLPPFKVFFSYILGNFFLFISQKTISGVFVHNFQPEIINGSLWSLFPEFLCYIALPLIGLLALLTKRKKLLLALFIIYLLGNGIEGLRFGYFEPSAAPDFFRVLFEIRRYSAYFFAGMLFYLFTAKKTFPNYLFYVFLAGLLISIIFRLYNFIGPILLPYVIIGLAIKLPFAAFSRIGDYSYGLYIYAFPMQQTIYFLNPYMKSPVIFFFTTVAVTLPLAFLSWHFVENPALKLKSLSSTGAKR